MGVEYSSVRRLARDFGSIPDDLRRQMRPKMRAAGVQVANAVKAAASFSDTIPGAVRVSTSFASRTGGVRVWVDASRAPHARALENMGQQGTFRHPVFGNRDVWVQQEAHPFFFRTVASHQEKVRKAVAEAVRDSLPRGTTL